MLCSREALNETQESREKQRHISDNELHIIACREELRHGKSEEKGLLESEIARREGLIQRLKKGKNSGPNLAQIVAGTI